MSQQASGAKLQVLIDEETNYKSDPASPDGKKLVVVSCGLKAEQSLITDESLTGVRDRVTPDIGNKKVGGAIVVNLDETNHATLLKHVLGSSTPVGSSDPYTHTIKVGSLPVGLVIEKGFLDINQFYKYNGCRVASANFKVASEGYIQTTFNIIGAKETQDTSSYDDTPTSLAHKALTAFQAVLKEGGSVIAKVLDFDFTISNDLDEGGYVVGGNGEIVDLPEGFCQVDGSLKLRFEDDILLAKARASTKSSLELILDKNLTPARSLTLKLPELVFGVSGPEVSGPKGVTVTLPFQAFHDTAAEGVSVQIILENGLATI